MRVTRLKLANVRSIKMAEFHFRPGFNLVVGVNGVGKTTVIEALAISLSGVIIKRIYKFRMRTKSFGTDAIRVDADSMDVECEFEIGGIQDRYRIHKTRVDSVPSIESKVTPSVHDGRADPAVVDGEQVGRPFAILFSTNRAVPFERKPSKVSTAGNLVTALAGAFSHRELHLAEFADWIRVQRALSSEYPWAKRTLATLEEIVKKFLSDYKNLHLGGMGDHILLIDRDEATLPVRQLSDGERGLLALVLDLTRRLSQANPEMKHPAKAEAVVLIDEIDLHLHPKWQRQIVHNLTDAFPKCQFIATTHSPQIIGEVESDRIHIIADGQVYSPSHSRGIDSSRVLEEIMDADSRTRIVHELLTEIGHEIDEDRFEQARCSLSSLSDILGEDDPEVVRLHTLLDFLEENE